MRLLYGCCAALLIAASASAETTQIAVEYPFKIERSLTVGQAFTAAKGEKPYVETSFGQPGLFLTERFVDDDYDVTIETGDALAQFPFSRTEQPFFGRAKQIPMMAHCPDKVGSRILDISSVGKVRRTKCFIDDDGDQHFDHWVTGYAEVVENFGSDDTPFGVRRLFFLALEPMTPIGYSAGAFLPYKGKEGVVELRYDGTRGERAIITVSARLADSSTPLYQRPLEFSRPKTEPVELTIENPVLGSDAFRVALGHDATPGATTEKPRKLIVPIPTMKVSITQADAKSVSGSVVSALPDWVLFSVPCEGAAAAGSTSCDAVTFRDGLALMTISPGAPGRFSRTAATVSKSR